MFIHMFQRLVKKTITIGVLVAVFLSGFRYDFFGEAIQYTLHAHKEANIVDKIYLAKKNKNVVDNFRNSLEHASAATDPAELEYLVDIGPITGSVTSGYTYASFFNPSGSGRTAVIKRIAVRANAVAAANYVNLTVRRTSAASAGTLLTASEVPKKNGDSSDSVVQIRHTGVTTTLSGTADSRILGQAMPGAAGEWTSARDITMSANDEKIIIQPGEGIAVYQEAAGDADQRIRVYIEWEEVASAPTALDEFLFTFPRVENAAAANYVYNSFFNPGTSGKTAIVRRIWFGSENCDTAAVYTNNIVLRRTSAASAGTQVTATNVPKKHTGSANSVMEFRHTGVTVTQVGGTDARLGHVTPCGAAGQANGWAQINFAESDEELILQPGQGIALMSDAVGDIDQIVRMIIEWDEVASGSTPTAQNEYIWASPRVEVAATANQNFFTFFNPVGSGKNAIIKKLAIRVNADTTATYQAFSWRRLTAASGGTLIAAADLPKKHTSTANTVMEVRWCGAACASAITTTYAGGTDSRLLTVNGAGTLGQTIGQTEVSFSPYEKIVLKPGEGIGFYTEAAGDIDQYVKVSLEWGEETTAPTNEFGYLLNIGPINGSTATSYNYATFFNPAASATTTIINRIRVRVDAAGAAVYAPMQVRRISAASAGTQITAANIPKKNTSSGSSIMEVRHTGVTATYVGSANDSKLISVHTPGAVAAATAPATTGYAEYEYIFDEPIVLRAGQGIGLYHDSIAGNANFRVKLFIEWQEVPSGSTPAAENEYQVTAGPTVGAAATGYTYASFFNPTTSNKVYAVKRVAVRSNRTGTLVAPGYLPVTIRKVTSASGGTLFDVNNIPEKNTASATSTAEIRFGATVSSFFGTAASRILGVTSPGAVNQIIGVYESNIIDGDELILQPGEGLALYQESNAGDNLIQYRLSISWKEVDANLPHISLSGFRFFANSNSLDVGAALAGINTAAALSAAGDAFRLRLLMHVATSTLAQGRQNFALQFAGKGAGSCASPSGTPATYTDVTNHSLLSFNQNTLAREGFLLTTNANDPTHGGDTISTQIYTAWANFSNSLSSILFGRDGKWDLSLKDNGAAAGTSYCLRVAKTSNPMWSWGGNEYGQLGQGGATSTQNVTLTQIGALTNWKTIEPGSRNTYALRSDGTLWVWGDNSFAQLGQGFASSSQHLTTPVQVGTSNAWTYIGSGNGYFAGAIDTSGRLWMWGDNFWGQTSQATTTTPVTAPTQVGSDTTWSSVSTGFGQTVAIKTNGTMWSWGDNAKGQLGNGTITTPIVVPAQIGTDTDWVNVTTGTAHSVAIKSNGTMWAWGDDDFGQLGHGGATTTPNPVPTQIGTDTDWLDVEALGGTNIALKTDGTLWGWGSNTSGQLGQGASSTPVTAPVQIGTDTDWVDVSVGAAHVLAIKSNGTMWSWGNNVRGQVGSGSTGGNFFTPTQIGTDTNWRLAKAGSVVSYALRGIDTTLDAYDVYPELATAGGGPPTQDLSFILSTSTIYFGTLSSASTRYASSTNTAGSATEVQAHTFAVKTNASSGYTVTVRGQTLTSQQNAANTITALGGTNTSPSVGSEQFGIRLTASGGIGAVTAPYAASGFAYAATATTTNQVASAVTGDSATTTYSVRYMTNIAPVTEAGSYRANIVYVVTANF